MLADDKRVFRRMGALLDATIFLRIGIGKAEMRHSGTISGGEARNSSEVRARCCGTRRVA